MPFLLTVENNRFFINSSDSSKYSTVDSDNASDSDDITSNSNDDDQLDYTLRTPRTSKSGELSEVDSWKLDCTAWTCR
jgi:hypothetical protein